MATVAQKPKGQCTVSWCEDLAEFQRKPPAADFNLTSRPATQAFDAESARDIKDLYDPVALFAEYGPAPLCKPHVPKWRMEHYVQVSGPRRS